VLRLGEISDYFTLSPDAYRSIASEGSQNFLMTKILTPCLELLRCAATCFAKLDQRFAQTMWIEVRQASSRKCISNIFRIGVALLQ
jgi:hypothetical protein